MGQASSQEIQESPVSPVKKAPPRPQEPPKLQVQPTPRPPSYAVPENKVLPSELPSKPLRAVSSAFAKSNPEVEKLFVDKENKPLENGSVNLDHNFFPEGIKTDERNDSDTDFVVLRNKDKYKAPSPPVASVLPVNSQGNTGNISIDPFYNRAALAHRRTHSLDRLPGNRANGHPRRPVSAVNLTSSEHTIFEDPEEANQNNKYTSLPQKSTFPLDYSYAVTYAQLAGHRRKQVQPKLETEKEVLLKRQSLPDLQENKNMDQNIDMYLIREGEIDLDNLTPRRKKYKAPAPPSISQISKQAVVLQTSSSANQKKGVPVSRHRKQTAPAEPPVDYDTGEIATSKMNHQKQSVESVTPNEKAVVSPMSADMKVTGLQNVHSKETIGIDKKKTQTSSPKLIIQRQSSSIESASPTSPKSPPPPVKPKPIRSPDEGKFRFPNSPSKPETDVVTINGQVIPEVRRHPPVQEVVSLSIDSKSETVRAAIVTPLPTQTIPQSPQSPRTEAQLEPVTLPVVSNAAGYPIQMENRGTIHLSAESKTEGTPAAPKLNSVNLPAKQNSVDVAKQSTCFSESPVNGDIKMTSEKGLNSIDKSYELEVKPSQMGSPVTDIKPIPIGLATDIVLETSSVCDSNPPTVSQSQSGSDSGVNMPLSDQSFESLTTGDRSMEMEGTTVTDDEPISTRTEQVSQGTMTITPEIIEDKREHIIKSRQLDRSQSTSSSDSAKPVSPPLTPDDNLPPKMNSLLQNDIVAAAQVRVLKLKKPVSAPPRPKHPDEVFKEELAKLHKEREGRFSKSLSVEEDVPSDTVENVNIQDENTKDDVSMDKDTDSGIQACSFSEDWTPEHDLDDSDEEHRSAHTSRSGLFYDGRKGKAPVKPTNSSSSSGRVKLLRKSDSDVSDKFGSLRRFRQNVHKSVKHALSSVNKQTSKPSKLDKRSSLPPPVPSSSEPKQPVFRKLDPDAPQQPMNNVEQNHVSENGINKTQVEQEKKMPEEEPAKQSDTDQQVMKKAGVAYVSGNAQIVLLPEFETAKSSSETGSADDGHRAPKRWKKVKKFAYMATTRKKEKQRMEQLLKERVEEQERRMEEERLKQLEMEREFMKVRQLDQPAVMPNDETDGSPSKNRNSPKKKSPPEVPQNAVNPHQGQVRVNGTAQGQVTVNGTPQGQVTLNGLQSSTVASFTMPGLVQAPNLVTPGQPAINPLLLNGQAYNPWLGAQPVQNLTYPTTMGWGIPNYATVPSQYTTSLPYDLTNYMQMLDVNGQSVNMPLNNGLINGYNVATQSLDRNQTNGLIHYNGATGYSAANGTLQQQNSVEANNYNNSRSLKQTIYVNPGPIDDTVLNQMYAEYQNGNRNSQLKGQDKNRSNPLYYSSDEEEEYDVSDVHTGRTHSKGTVARISVPAHHSHPIQPVHYADEEMSSPCSVTSSSADSGTPNYPIKLNGTVPHQLSVPPAYFRSASDPVNLDESYSSADR